MTECQYKTKQSPDCNAWVDFVPLLRDDVWHTFAADPYYIDYSLQLYYRFRSIFIVNVRVTALFARLEEFFFQYFTCFGKIVLLGLPPLAVLAAVFRKILLFLKIIIQQIVNTLSLHQNSITVDISSIKTSLNRPWLQYVAINCKEHLKSKTQWET